MSESVSTLGLATYPSPLRRVHALEFVSDDTRVLRETEVSVVTSSVAQAMPDAFQKAGPREKLFFDPATMTVGIVSAGGICPGINDVLRAMVMELYHGYGVQKMLGFRFGLAGLDASFGHEPLVLDPSSVRDIHLRAGTLLGTSRGPRDPSKMVDTLQKHGVNALLVIGGDGSMRAAHALHEEVVRRGLSIGVVGVPKTIDNDISFVDKTFGFETAVAAARDVIDVAHAEARSVENGVGLVKLMGRHAGFIAATATVASHEVNACLVPEVPFNLLGESGLLRWVEQRLAQRGHAVVVVAEGCAVHEIPAQAVRDASGNVRFSSAEVDVGMHLKQAMEQYFTKVKTPLTLKYIDPSYTVRALRASASDAAFCDVLGRHAIHAVMAGKTDMLVGRWHRSFTHVPLTSVLSNQKRIEPSSDLWQEVVHSTGQPSFTD